jgi:transcription initiation factor TFIIF subunit alpha
MRFHQVKALEKPVDPTNKEDFTRPVTLQRRDPRQPPPGRAVKEDMPEPPPVDDKETERLEVLKAEREAQKALDMAKIAPGSKDPAPKRPQKQAKERPTQFNRVPRTEKQKKEGDLRYEEALPWHLEDADGKNVWVGQYVSQLSETNVAFVINGASFRMIPLEKSYKMLPRPPFKAFTTEEAEAMMKDTKKKGEIGRWVMKAQEKQKMENELAETRSFMSGPRRIVTESRTFRAAARSEKMDHDELDMSGDEFQDDDDAPGFEVNEDEENKDSTTRIRRNQLGANLFGDADEQEVDKEEAEVKREEKQREMMGKGMRKALVKRERELNYLSDNSSSNPFESSSEVRFKSGGS